MAPRTARLSAEALALTALLLPAPARPGPDDGPALGGSVRLIPSVARAPRVRMPEGLTAEEGRALQAQVGDRTSGTTEGLLRITGAGALGERLRGEVHLVQSFTLRSGTGGGAPLLPDAATDRYRATPGRWRWFEDDGVQAQAWIDRLWVKATLPGVDLVVGRQAVTFGQTFFWNPLDVFRGFDPFQIDRDYKPGVDALRVDAPLGEFSGVTAVAALGPDRGRGRRDESAAVLRAFTTWKGFDLTVQGGRVRAGTHLGAGFTGEVGPLAVRGEAAQYWPVRRDAPPRALTAVAGAGRRFASGLVLEVEYLYNGAGRRPVEETWAWVERGELLHVSEHVIAASATGSVTPLLTLSLTGAMSLSDGSAVLQPGLTYSVADEVDLLAGALVAIGEPPAAGAAGGPVRLRSEFGSYPALYYLELKAYF